MGWIEEEVKTVIGHTPVSSVIRYKKNEESYTWTCWVDYFWDSKTVVLSAALTAPNVTEARTVKRYFKDKDIKTLIWDRRKGIRRRTANFNLGE